MPACQQSLGALLIQPGGSQLSVGADPPATAQHCAHPALPVVQLCPESHTVMPKAESPCPLPASSPCTTLSSSSEFPASLFTAYSCNVQDLFHFRTSSTSRSSQMWFEWCLTVPSSRDTSPAAGPCTQQTRPQLPVSHASQ